MNTPKGFNGSVSGWGVLTCSPANFEEAEWEEPVGPFKPMGTPCGCFPTKEEALAEIAHLESYYRGRFRHFPVWYSVTFADRSPAEMPRA